MNFSGESYRFMGAFPQGVSLKDSSDLAGSVPIENSRRTNSQPYSTNRKITVRTKSYPNDQRHKIRLFGWIYIKNTIYSLILKGLSPQIQIVKDLYFPIFQSTDEMATESVPFILKNMSR